MQTLARARETHARAVKRHRRPSGSFRAGRLCRLPKVRAARELVDVRRRAWCEEGRADAKCFEGDRAPPAPPSWPRACANRLAARARGSGPFGEEALEKAFPVEVGRCCAGGPRVRDPRRWDARGIETRGRNDTPLDETFEQVRESVREFAGSRDRAPGRAASTARTRTCPRSSSPRWASSATSACRHSRRVRRLRDGQPRDDPHHRRALAGLPGRGRLPHHAPRDPHQGPAHGRRNRRAEARSGCRSMAFRRGDGRHRRHRAGHRQRCRRRQVPGRARHRWTVEGWVINGPKAWCTFAGRANVLALLARTDPDASKGAKGLSLFVVPKETFDRATSSRCTQPGRRPHGGQGRRHPGLPGHALLHAEPRGLLRPGREPGRRAKTGLGRGFYLQMAGFAAGRLQTGGRACGLAQAALEKTAEYVVDRSQFDQAPLGVPAHPVHPGAHGGPPRGFVAPSPTRPPRPWTRTSGPQRRWPRRRS